MKITLIVILISLLCGCVTRNKVLFNKTPGPRWVVVDNPAEFLNNSEIQFLGEAKGSTPSPKK